MKTSTKYIIAFLTFVLVGILTLFIVTRNHVETPPKLFKEEFSLPNFSVIVSGPQTRFYIESGDTNKLTISYPGKVKDSRPISYFVKNDTLFFVEKDDRMNFERKILIQCANVKTIVARHNDGLVIEHFNAKSLTILADSGTVDLGCKYYTNNGELLFSLLDINCIAQNKSIVTIQQIKTDQIKVKAVGSEVYLKNMSIKNVSADIKDHSRLEGENIEDKELQIDLKIDSLSTYFFRE